VHARDLAEGQQGLGTVAHVNKRAVRMQGCHHAIKQISNLDLLLRQELLHSQLLHCCAVTGSHNTCLQEIVQPLCDMRCWVLLAAEC
jgi:hypothetical protein